MTKGFNHAKTGCYVKGNTCKCNTPRYREQGEYLSNRAQVLAVLIDQAEERQQEARQDRLTTRSLQLYRQA